MSTTNKPVKAPPHPVRTLAILAFVMFALVGATFIQGASTINLGLDLRGGTSVTLQPRIAVGESGEVSKDAIDQAVSIIRQRVNSLGVAESEVTARGTGASRQIVISVPGEAGRRVVELVGQTAELRFRQVLAVSNAVGASSDAVATPVAGVSAQVNAEYTTLDCSLAANREGGGTDAATAAIVACDRDGVSKFILAPAEVLGRQVSKASAGIDQQSGNAWFVSLTFDGEGTKAFGSITSRVTTLPSPQNQIAIVLDGLVVSAPRINEAIPGGNAQITGNFTQVEATDLANVLKYGALPLAFDRGEVQQISATLGADQLQAGLLAGFLGLGLVVLFLLLFYRGLGIIGVATLAIAGGLVYLLFLLLGKWIGFTLTLAGIAGAIVAIGIVADSFIVYFERIRDEIRDGRSLRSAVETGWVRARRTILVADFVSMIAAVLLYFFAVGEVRGFAFALGLMTLVDLIVVFGFTKPAMTILARMNFYHSGHSLSGFSAKSLGIIVPAKEA